MSNRELILVVDDNPEVRDNVCEILSLDDYRTCSASDGLEALEALASLAPALVLCDVSMPNLDGIGFVAQARQSDIGRTVPIVMLSALAERDTMRKAMALGADDYVTKPFSPEDILVTVQTQLTKRQVLQQAAVSEMAWTPRETALRTLPQELGAPLATIAGLGRTLADRAGTMPTGQVREYGRMAADASGHLDTLIRQYLTHAHLSMLEKTEHWPVLVPPVVVDEGHVSDMLESRLSTDTHELRPDIESGLLKAAPEVLEFVALELVEFVARFADEGEPVAIVGRKGPGRYRLTFSASGAPLPEATTKALAGPEAVQRDRNYQDGVGIALELAGLMVRRVGAAITVEDRTGRPNRLAVDFLSG